MVGRATFFFSRQRGMQLQIGQVRRPHQGRQILRQAILHKTIIAFAPYLGRFDPFGAVRRAVFLIKELASTPLG